MKYIGTSDLEQNQQECLGVLVVNLGTPDSPETGPVRRYLAQFLSDPRIIEMPRWLWRIILHGFILRVRPSRSAKAYQEVWSEETGSPLLHYSKLQAEGLQQALTRLMAGNTVVALGMRYGQPSIEHAIEQLEKSNAKRLIVLPMYPQYSCTTTASAIDAITLRMQRTRWIPEMRFINQYYQEPEYIKALANSVRQSWEEKGKGELLLLSFHGIPKRYKLAGDPYFNHCQETAKLLAAELGIADDKYRVVFQSRVGREEWLKPYCDETMKALPAEGITSIDVMSPAFSSDCLETIEEICGENREYFEDNGGKRFEYIACLNERPDHINFLARLVARHAQGWPEAATKKAN